MTVHLNEGDSVRGRRLLFQGRRVGKVRVIQLTGTHRGREVTLDDGECWIETPIQIP